MGLPGVLLKEDILPPQEKTTLQVPAKGVLSSGDRGSCTGNIILPLLTVQCDRFQALVQASFRDSGLQTQPGETLLWRKDWVYPVPGPLSL